MRFPVWANEAAAKANTSAAKAASEVISLSIGLAPFLRSFGEQQFNQMMLCRHHAHGRLPKIRGQSPKSKLVRRSN